MHTRPGRCHCRRRFTLRVNSLKSVQSRAPQLGPGGRAPARQIAARNSSMPIACISAMAAFGAGTPPAAGQEQGFAAIGAEEKLRAVRVPGQPHPEHICRSARVLNRQAGVVPDKRNCGHRRPPPGSHAPPADLEIGLDPLNHVALELRKRRCARRRFSWPELACSLVGVKGSFARLQRRRSSSPPWRRIRRWVNLNNLDNIGQESFAADRVPFNPSFCQAGAVRGGRAIHTRLYRVEPMATLCGLAQGFRATVRKWAAAPRLPPELPLMSRYNSAVAANIRLLVFKIRTARSTTTPGGCIPRNRR